MYRGTTPTLTIRVTGEDFADSTVYVTLEQGNTELTKTDAVITPTQSGSTIALFLTQEETLLFTEGVLGVQIRWINSSGIAQASPIKNVKIKPILLEGVITYA